MGTRVVREGSGGKGQEGGREGRSQSGEGGW